MDKTEKHIINSKNKNKLYPTIHTKKQKSFRSNRILLVDVAPREGRTKPGEDDSINGTLAVLSICNCSNKTNQNNKIDTEADTTHICSFKDTKDKRMVPY